MKCKKETFVARNTDSIWSIVVNISLPTVRSGASIIYRHTVKSISAVPPWACWPRRAPCSSWRAPSRAPCALPPAASPQSRGPCSVSASRAGSTAATFTTHYLQPQHLQHNTCSCNIYLQPQHLQLITCSRNIYNSLPAAATFTTHFYKRSKLFIIKSY